MKTICTGRSPTALSVSAVCFFADCFESRSKLAIPFCFELFNRNKSHRRRIHAVAHARWCRAIIKHVPEMRVCMRRTHFRSPHAKLGIHQIPDVLGQQRTREARPAGARVKLVKGTEQRFAGHDVDVNAGVVVVVKWIAEAALGSATLRDIKLLRSERRFELGLTRFLEVFVIFHAD